LVNRFVVLEKIRLRRKKAMITLITILTKIFNFIKLHWKVVLAAVLGAVFFAKAQGCYHRVFPSKQPVSGPSTPAVKPLPKDDRERIVVSNNTVEVTTSRGTTSVNGSRGVTVDVKKDGTIQVTPKTHGFVLNPLIGFGVNNTGLKGIVGAEIYYYKKLDLIGGMGADQYLSHTAIFVAIGYCPENKLLHNTNIWIGPMLDVTGSKGVMAGVTVRI
jgi:hypothetical protein